MHRRRDERPRRRRPRSRKLRCGENLNGVFPSGENPEGELLSGENPEEQLPSGENPEEGLPYTENPDEGPRYRENPDSGPGYRRFCRRAGSVFLCLLLTAAAAGCGTGKQTERKSMAGEPDRGNETVLTERQRLILRERHLPEEYEELTAVQKDAIRTIEELLCCLEEKYDRRFVFIEYCPPSPADPDTVSMLFRGYGDPPDRRAAVIRRSGHGEKAVCTDDYPSIAAERVCERMLADFVKGQTGASCKAYAFVSSTALKQIPVSPEDVEGSVSADACVWISAGDMSKEQMKNLAGQMKEWLQEKGMAGRCQIMLLEADAWEKVSRGHYAEFFRKDTCICREIIRIRA